MVTAGSLGATAGGKRMKSKKPKKLAVPKVAEKELPGMPAKPFKPFGGPAMHKKKKKKR